jgi:hypothetical protein
MSSCLRWSVQFAIVAAACASPHNVEIPRYSTDYRRDCPDCQEHPESRHSAWSGGSSDMPELRNPDSAATGGWSVSPAPNQSDPPKDEIQATLEEQLRQMRARQPQPTNAQTRAPAAGKGAGSSAARTPASTPETRTPSAGSSSGRPTAPPPASTPPTRPAPTPGPPPAAEPPKAGESSRTRILVVTGLASDFSDEGTTTCCPKIKHAYMASTDLTAACEAEGGTHWKNPRFVDSAYCTTRPNRGAWKYICQRLVEADCVIPTSEK